MNEFSVIKKNMTLPKCFSIDFHHSFAFVVKKKYDKPTYVMFKICIIQITNMR